MVVEGAAGEADMLVPLEDDGSDADAVDGAGGGLQVVDGLAPEDAPPIGCQILVSRTSNVRPVGLSPPQVPPLISVNALAIDLQLCHNVRNIRRTGQI